VHAIIPLRIRLEIFEVVIFYVFYNRKKKGIRAQSGVQTMHPISPVVADENLYGGASTLPSSYRIAVHEHLKPCTTIAISKKISTQLIHTRKKISRIKYLEV
jgi:hypothetical protein